MDRVLAWLGRQSARRPLWMNVLLFFCTYLTFIYMPFDFFLKPVAQDAEAWFGILLHGWMAKLTEPIHWAIYAAGMVGLWRMSPWMWPAAAYYAAAVCMGMLVWPILYIGGVVGILLGLMSFVVFGAVALALWNSRELFRGAPENLRSRYGQWAVVTGASAGIGAEFARALAADGVSCVLTARRRDLLDNLAAELKEQHSVEVRVVEADLATDQGVAAVVGAVADLEIAILVNNAGVGYAGRFSKQDGARLNQMIRLNCVAPVALTHAMLPTMVARGCGAVIVVGSVAGRQGVPLHTVYSATKGFDLLFGEGLWGEVQGKGVDVLVVQPGPVATEFEAVAGEARLDPAADESAHSVVSRALASLGRQPSMVSGWFNWVRANVNRVLPRTVVLFVAHAVMEKQTPKEMR